MALAAALRCLAAAERLPPLDWGAVCRALLQQPVHAGGPAASSLEARVRHAATSEAVLEVHGAALSLALAAPGAAGAGAMRSILSVSLRSSSPLAASERRGRHHLACSVLDHGLFWPSHSDEQGHRQRSSSGDSHSAALQVPCWAT